MAEERAERRLAAILAADVVDRVPALGAAAAQVKQLVHDKLIAHREYIGRHGIDMPEIRDWQWPQEVTETRE